MVWSVHYGPGFRLRYWVVEMSRSDIHDRKSADPSKKCSIGNRQYFLLKIRSREIGKVSGDRIGLSIGEYRQYRIGLKCYMLQEFVFKMYAII